MKKEHEEESEMETCPTCNGKKQIECTDCHTPEMECDYCVGQSYPDIDEPHKCPSCPKCENRGYNCTVCNNTGIATCPDCLGEGVI